MFNPTVQPFTQSEGISNGEQIKGATKRFIQNGKIIRQCLQGPCINLLEIHCPKFRQTNQAVQCQVTKQIKKSIRETIPIEDQEVYGDIRYVSVNTSHTVLEKDVAVDTWIDKLTDSYESYEISREISLTWMLQQYLLRIKTAIFDGFPLLWVEFIINFKGIVHNKSFLWN